MSLSSLIEMSRRYGAGAAYGPAGGDASYKENGILYVKRPDCPLADVTEADFAAESLSVRTGEATGLNPEALLHAAFPQRYVLHVYPALAGGLACGREGAAACARLFGGQAAWVPLPGPGQTLAAACKEVLSGTPHTTQQRARAAFLQNNGLILAADSVTEIDTLMRDILRRLEAEVQSRPDFAEVPFDKARACALAPALRMLYWQDGGAFAVFCANKQVMPYLQSGQTAAPLMAAPTPVHIRHCQSTPLYIKPDEDYPAAFRAYAQTNGYAPKIVLVEGLGFFALGDTKKEAEATRLLFLDAVQIAVYSEAFGGYSPLPEAVIRESMHCEREAFPRKAGHTGRLRGKIAIITGSAQGFGKGIAEVMAREGATVVIADLNGEGASACAKELTQAHGEGCALPVQVNVADEASVEAMVQATVLAYGGLDILVSNAGIAIAGSLEEMTKERFELVSAVNYTGYFLCTKYATRPMKIQHAIRPGLWADVIEINSKSGLSGSNKNFAYAGSKFGGVGLTQSFALELVTDGIKVNAICPGNLLDGPLWSDPEKGLFKQYLDAGKVPGAKTVADVRAFYEAKVPMGRGCLTGDVGTAILYVVEQQYETGQAIPVTGGQIMLH